MIENRIDKAYAAAKRMELKQDAKIVLISDCHRGNGGGADDFAKNQALFYYALSYYNQKGYTYIELGDGDELWECKRMGDIKSEYDLIFGLMADMYRDGRFFMIYGNHDMVKKDSAWAADHLNSYRCGHPFCKRPLFPQIPVYESILLDHKISGNEILLLHGHQADFFNDKLWKLGRFLVRHIWRSFELIGLRNPQNTSAKHKQWRRIEEILCDWSDRNGKMVIAGHTHRVVYPEVGECLYFNDGSCVHPRYITVIEICGDEISLVSWGVSQREDGTLYIKREVMHGPKELTEFFAGGQTPLCPAAGSY